jgi:hypothetical protein
MEKLTETVASGSKQGLRSHIAEPVLTTEAFANHLPRRGHMRGILFGFLLIALFHAPANAANCKPGMLSSDDDNIITTYTSKIDKVNSYSDKTGVHYTLEVAENAGQECPVQFITLNGKPPSSCIAGATVTATGTWWSEYGYFLQDPTSVECR